jgi:hypothetical protein
MRETFAAAEEAHFLAEAQVGAAISPSGLKLMEN